MNDSPKVEVNSLPIEENQADDNNESDISGVENPSKSLANENLLCNHSAVPEIIKNSYLFELDD